MAPQWRRLQSLFAPTDEEMGKKDDDRKPSSRGTWVPASRIAPRPSVARRLVPLLVIIAIFYLCIDWIRSEPSVPKEYNPIFPKYGGSGASSGNRPWANLYPPARSPPQSQSPKQEKERSRSGQAPLRKYNGDFTLVPLARSLREISMTAGSQKYNRNVLFVSSSAKSAASLLPLACEMARERRNYVHYAIMNRSEKPLKELLRLNGVDDSCGILFHDARPDRAAESADLRVRMAAERAFFYLETYVHPQAVIVDGTETEETTFSEALHAYFEKSEQSIIELPHNGAQRLGWLAKLDSASLSAWSKVNFEIVIHAPMKGSGSLIRLLRSLSDADFTPFPTPRLTLELPHDIEEATTTFLEGFSWPPKRGGAHSTPQMLSLRRRLALHRMDEQKSVERFLESAWPTAPQYSHVLVLSTQAELSRHFAHYLKYALLEYRYSAAARRQRWDERLVGISLDLPSTYLNASEPFSPPGPASDSKVSSPDETSFLWQAPSSNAMLILGDKWTELHNFVAYSQEARQTAPTPSPLLSQKLVSKAFPAWLEHLLQLSRLRGYFTLYPSAETASTLAVIHEDLAQLPEEYSADKDAAGLDARKTQTQPGKTSSRRKEPTLVVSHSALDALRTLPDGGVLLPFGSLPLLGWEGDRRSLEELDDEAREYAREFRREVGRCTGTDVERARVDAEAKDLFCWVR